MAHMNATKNLSDSFFILSQVSNSNRDTKTDDFFLNLKADDLMKDAYFIAVIEYPSLKTQTSTVTALP